MPHERCVIAFLSNQSVIGFYICLMKYIEREPGHIQKSEYQREYIGYISYLIKIKNTLSNAGLF